MPSPAPGRPKHTRIAPPHGSVPPTRAAKPQQSAPVFPVWLRFLPKSAFPIRSQEDLASKVSDLLLSLSPQRVVTPATGHGLPARQQSSGRKKDTAS
jgi:hypothetical protein